MINRIVLRSFITIILATFYSKNTCNAQDIFQLAETKVEVMVVKNRISVPWEIIWGPNDQIWYTSSPGKVTSLDPETGTEKLLLQLDDYYPGGLTDTRMMGLTVDQEFDNNSFVYINYVYKGASYSSKGWNKYMKVVRYEYNATNTQLENPLVLLDEIKVYSGWHVGGKMLAGPDGTLFITIGDVKQPENPEDHPDWDGELDLPLDINVFPGKILRINRDGSVPQDNPFAEAPFDKTAKNLIWTLGHRNTQGLVYGSEGQLYYAEHGPSNDDEVGLVVKGGDYGWPAVEGYCESVAEQKYCVDQDNFQDPMKIWTPTIAPSNMEYYNHDLIPEWKNSLLIATLSAGGRGQDIRVLKLNETGDKITDEDVVFDNQYLRIRDLCVAPTGEVYFTSSNTILNSGSLGADDKIFKIAPAPPVLNIEKESGIGLSYYGKNQLLISHPRLQIESTRSYTLDGKELANKLIKNEDKSILSFEGLNSGLSIVLVYFTNGQSHRLKYWNR